MIRDLVRAIIVEELESMKNDYVVSQDLAQKKIRPVTSEDIKIRFPEFHTRVAEALFEEERIADLRGMKWAFYANSYTKVTPFAYDPVTGAVCYWHAPSQHVKQSENSEIDNAIIQMSR